MPVVFAIAALLSLSSCASAPPVDPSPEAPLEGSVEAIHALAFSKDGARLYYAAGIRACELRVIDAGTRGVLWTHELSFCPERVTTLADGSVLVSSDSASAWLGPEGQPMREGRTVLAAIDDAHLLERSGGELTWLDGERSVVLDVDGLRSPRMAAGGTLLGILSDTQGERIVRFDGATPSAVTPMFRTIDSWEVAPRGDEIVFSADTGAGFDVGIVAVSGGDVTWVAPEPADEKNVTWAPRGNKITYTFESLDATLVRSVHVPTSFQVIFDLPLTAVRQIAWEPRAERFAMVNESPAAGPRIEWVGYQGESRAVLVDPAERIDTRVEALFWENGNGILFGPGTIRYGETRATVVWVESGDPFAYREEVSRLWQAGVAVIVTTNKRLSGIRPALEELPWHDRGRVYVVDVSGRARLEDAPNDQALFLTREVSDANGPGLVTIPGDDARFRAEALRRVLAREAGGSSRGETSRVKGSNS